MCIYTKDSNFSDKFNELDLNTVFNEDRDTVKFMYVMDMVIAAIMLVVSICLILISMIILRFTIHFTMSEEFREIVVMKAIGITTSKIRGLYLIKYFVISMLAGIIGLGASVPFGGMMLGYFRQKIIVSTDGLYFLNVLCAFAVVAIVMLFCYFCTRRMKHFSPIDAIRNGENGEESLLLYEKYGARLIVLDIMLPGMDGFAVCRKIRESGNTPIFIVSAKTEKDDKLNGLILGADDYIEKPYDIDI